ncbi:MAG: PqqD family peptide modification chaperone [Geminicoccaceae bacterium]
MADSIEAIPFDGHLVLVADERQIIVLNETARSIWEAIGSGATPADVAQCFVERFGLAPEHARADVEAALADWRARGLIGASPAREAWVPPPPEGDTAAPTDFDLDRVYALCGRPIRFRFQDPELATLIDPLLAPSETSAAPQEIVALYRDDRDHVRVANGVEIGRSPLAEEVLGLAVGWLLEASYPRARWLAMFHAGAVADQDHAIVLAAASGSGKSTLTAALVHSGLRYLSDDVVPLDGRTLRIMPVPFAVSIKEGSWPVLAGRFPELERLPTHQDRRPRRYLDLSRHAHDGVRSIPVKVLLFPHYRSAGPTRLQQLGPAQALERLLEARLWICLDRRELSMTLDWLMGMPSYAMEYSSIDDAVSTVKELSLEIKGQVRSS